MGVAAVATLVAVNSVALANLDHRSKRTVHVAAPSTPATIVAAASWAARELPLDAKIIADPITRAALAADRFTAIQTPTASSSGAALTFDYAVSTPALRDLARAGNPVDRALKSSLPIAVFSSGAHQVVVRQMSSAASTDIAARRVIDSDTRRAAERQLLANPAIRARGSARAALEAGQLDLRAATVLALIANSSHLVLLSVNVDEPERAAGLPARSIDVQTDAPTDVQATLNYLPPLYRPLNTQLPDGTYRMVWAIDPAPPPALN